MENITMLGFHFTVENIQQLKRFDSETVYVRGHPWYFRVKKFHEAETSLGVFLCTRFRENEDKQAISAHFAMEVKSPKYFRGTRLMYSQNVFTPKRINWGFRKIILWEDLINPENGYIKNGACEIYVEIHVGLIPDDEDIMEYRTVRKCCDGSIDGKLRFVFDLWHELRLSGICSREFILHDIPWRICVVKSENPKENQMVSIRLFEETKGSQKWSCKISLSCKLIPLKKSVLPIEKEMKNVTFGSNSIKTLDLAEWDKLIATGNGFIQNNSSVVEVFMKVEDVKGYVPEVKGKQSISR